MKWWQSVVKQRGWEAGALLILLGAALLVRTYRLNFPLADWHSFRQVDTAAVTREYVRRGVDLLHPRYHDVSNIQSGKENFAGWRMVEFPLMNAVTAWILQINPRLQLVPTSRLVSIVASLISLLSLYWLVRSWHGKLTAFLAAFFFAFLPYNIFYSRTVLPEPFMVMWSLLAAMALSFWQPKKQTTFFWVIVAALCWSMALLVKPMAIFFAPMYLGIVGKRWPLSWKQGLLFAVAFAAAGIPVYLWREWITQFPEGIPANTWLFNSNGIRLQPAWWRWLFAERIGKLMFGYWLASFLFLGLLADVPNWVKKGNWWQQVWNWKLKWWQSAGPLFLGTVGMMAYLVIFATGNVQHDYYQVPLVPVLCWLVARGITWVWEKAENALQRFGLVSGTLILIGLSFFFSWYEIRGNFNVNNWAMVKAGEAAKRLIPENSLVIAHYMGDTTLLFHTQRWGWPIGFEIEDKIAKGAEFYISTSLDDEANRLKREYTVVEETPEYIIIDLRQPVDPIPVGEPGSRTVR